MILQPKTGAIPKEPGIYLFKKAAHILYVGKAANLRKRLTSYWRKNAGAKVASLLREATKVEWQTTDSEIDALLLEAERIKKHQPQFNVVMRDDKNYFYVGISNDEFPRLFITHQPHQTRSKKPELRIKEKRIIHNSKFIIHRYLGPYTSGSALKITLKLLRRLFPYCTCKNPHKRPCLNAQIGRCLGFCCDKNQKQEVRSKNQGLYKKNIKNIIAVLSGKKRRLLSTLKKEMQRSAKDQEFEIAARLRNQIAGLENVFRHASIKKQEVRSKDIGRTRWKKVERTIQALFHTAMPISRVEGYDISNISGTEATGSMVVFVDGMPAKSEYRKFRIRSVRGANDVAMHREVLRRRLARTDWPKPDLILIDGGKPQLNTVKQEVRSKNQGKPTLLAALAKREEELYIEGRKMPVRLDSLPPDTKLFFQHVRDESHRFAKKYHHKLREIAYRKK